MPSGAKRWVLAKSRVFHRQIQHELDPVAAALHLGIGARSIFAFQAGRHVEEMFQRNGLFPGVYVGDPAVREEAQQTLIDAADVAVINGDADQAADDALGHRSDLMPNVRGIGMKIGFRNEIVVAHDQDAMQVDLVSLDSLEQLREQGRVHPLCFRR